MLCGGVVFFCNPAPASQLDVLIRLLYRSSCLRACIMAGAERAESDVGAGERRKSAARDTPARAGDDALRELLLAQPLATH